jgi:hypothetical protein
MTTHIAVRHKLPVMRRTAFTVLAAAALLLPAATAHAAPHTSRRCAAATYDWKVVYGGSPQYMQADWETNPGTCQTLQVLAHCYDSAGNVFYDVKSGTVRAVELTDRATCNAGDFLAAGYIRFNGGSWHLKWSKP